ncbi:MAG: SPFH domain-containing protein [Syntrophomonas sp.]
MLKGKYWKGLIDLYILLEINISKKRLQQTGLLLLFILGIFFLRPLAAVPDGYAGVKITQGKVEDKVIPAGFHLLLPGYQEIVNIDCRTQQLEVQVPVTSRDLYKVNTLLSLDYHINPSGVAKLYRQQGSDYESTLLTPVLQKSLQAVAIHYSAEEMMYRRLEIINQSSQLISRTLVQHNIAVDRLDITNFELKTSENPVYL